MADGTLSLLKRTPKQPPKVAEQPAAPKELPVFYPDNLAAQVGTDGGSYFVQGKNLFSLKGAFVSEAPEHLWYVTTPQQEENNRRTKARGKAAIVHSAAAPAPSVPEKVVNMARENARALAAEAHAE